MGSRRVVKVVREGNGLRTTGLPALRHRELVIPRIGGDAADGARMLQDIARYIRQGARIRPEETMRWGYWVLQFRRSPVGLEVWEFDQDCRDFVPGATRALTYHRQQQQTCARFGAAFSPSAALQLAAVSDGVHEGDPVAGVRYPPKDDDDSGWCLSTNRFDGTLDTVRREHLFHVTNDRLDVVPYLALPPGYRFVYSEVGIEVEFDARAARGED